MSAPVQQLGPAPAPRVATIDVLRGFVMTLMLAEVLHLSGLAKVAPDNAFFRFITFHTSHVPWQGASLHDLIQPGFSMLVGAALPFSIAARKARGATFRQMLAHSAWRAFVLIALGILLRSIGKPQTNYTFEDTLTQIGLAYLPLFLLGFASVRVQIAALVALLVGYWGLFVAYPLPSAAFDYPSVGVPANWPEHYTGFLSHWNKNSNIAWAFDTWFLNLFPREKPFLFNAGGYATLSFIPTLGTMILGLLAGGLFRSGRSHAEKLRVLSIAGAAMIALAVVLQTLGVCPIVKRIWTPGFTLYSGGLLFLMMAALYAVLELKGWRRWAFPLMVVGANSIAAYLMSWTMEGFFLSALDRHLVHGFELSPALGEVVRRAGVLVIFWLMLFWMYRRKIFIRI